MTNWLYPINPTAGYWFEDDRGDQILDSDGNAVTSPEAFWKSLECDPGTASPWHLSKGFRLMRPDDVVWIYAAGKTQKIIGMGRAAAIYESDQEWNVDLIWDLPVCSKLQQDPIPKSRFGDVPQAPRRCSPHASRVLDRWLADAGFETRVEAADQPDLDLDPEDARVRVLAEIVRRQGQHAFRSALADAYGGSCAISGCDEVRVLEAAHIHPYRGAKTNNVRNGLLLRADLHTLFDLQLIGVDADYRVVVDKSVVEAEYRKFHGRQLRLPSPKSTWPLKSELAKHCASINS